MAIKLIRVESFVSVLGLSEGALKSYQEFLNAFKWLEEQKGKETIPQLIEGEAPQGLINAFFHIISDYLRLIGLKIDQDSSSPRIYLRPGNTMEVWCEGIEIVPGREKILDGFEPKLMFFINLENPDEIKVTSHLQGEGRDLLSLITPTLLCFYLPKQDNSPVIQPPEGKRGIAIASIEQIRGFLENMKTIAQFLGDKEMEQLADAEMNMIKVPPELKEASRGLYALTLLKTLGLKI